MAVIRLAVAETVCPLAEVLVAVVLRFMGVSGTASTFIAAVRPLALQRIVMGWQSARPMDTAELPPF